jgi:putative glycosyltransferase (TIGR04372 family)
MKRLDVAIAVWGSEYVDIMLTWALPSFLAPGNLPACAKVIPVRVTIITRPQDEDTIRSNPVYQALCAVGDMSIVPLLTPDIMALDSRYSIMAHAHRYCIANSIKDGSIILMLSPDCILSDGSLSFGLNRILAGKAAVLVAGPRGMLEDVTRELAIFRKEGSIALPVPARDLVSAACRYPHDISSLLYWNDQPFSQFPSAVYWHAGSDSFLARYFHLHPLFVDASRIHTEAANSGTIDGTLLTLAKIPTDQIYVVENSDDACVIEISRADHDPMGSLPHNVTNKTWFMVKWATWAADATHRDQFKKFFFCFKGRSAVDWAAVVARSRRDTLVLDFLLRYVGLVPRRASLEHRARQILHRSAAKIRGVIRQTASNAKGFLLKSVRNGPNQTDMLGPALRWSTRILTPGPAATLARMFWNMAIRVGRAGQMLAIVYQRLTGTVINTGFFGRWANRPPMPSYIFEHMQGYFDIEVAPRRALHPGPIGKLAYRILRMGRIVFVVNIAPGTGHNTVEMDYFLRRLYAGELDRRSRYILLRLPSSFHDDTIGLYRRHFWLASNNRFLRNILWPVIIAHSELRLDSGLSRLKWHLRDDGSHSPPPNGQSFLYQVDKARNREVWQDYYRLRGRTGELTPVMDGLTPDRELIDLIGDNRRLALFHMKLHVANATAAPTSPENYELAIRYLKQSGYNVVHVGREPMPALFGELGVLNYAESAIRSYRHDLQLFSMASLAVTAGSGIALMPDCMNIPFVYLDSWHLGMPMASKNCVMVPAVIVDRTNGRKLSFKEQLDLYFSMADHGDESFPADLYSVSNATAEDVLAAVQEVEAFSAHPAPLSDLQTRFRALDSAGLGALTQARVSESFLRKNAALLADARAGAAKEMS